MGDFYNAIDIIAIASSDEGDPRPLIEGMACGCFPVATEVGIVTELVENGVNGLTVTGTRESFEQAFAWCARNVDFVRAAGRRNAERMARERTWAAVAPRWGDAFAEAIERANRGAAAPERSVAAC
jgi:glycosyltransferase involved in cell wall biosynthesis